MATYIGEMEHLIIGDKEYSLPVGGGGEGSVTSVAIANATNGGMSISGSPITSSGTITIGLSTEYGDTKNPYGNKTAHYVLAGPTSGSATAPSFRALVADDIPALNYVSPGDLPTITESSTTGITATTTATKTTLGTANSVTGVQSSTTTASKVTLGTAISIYGVKSGTNSTTTASKASGGNGSASNWVFEDVSCDDITNWAAGSGSFTQGSFTGGSIVVNNHVMSFTPATHGADSHSHTAPTLSYTTKTGSHVKSGGNGTAPTWSFTDVTVPIRADSATSIPNVTAATDVTVPIKNTSSTSIPNVSVTSATVSITDNGHTHSI